MTALVDGLGNVITPGALITHALTGRSWRFLRIVSDPAERDWGTFCGRIVVSDPGADPDAEQFAYPPEFGATIRSEP